METVIRKIFAFSKALTDFNIQILLIILSPITKSRAYKWANRPLAEVFAPVIIWWRHKPDIAKADNAHYFASCRNRAGIYGRGNYTKFPIVKTTEVYSIEIEELMKDRLRTEPNFFMGTREEVLAHIKNVRNEDFDNALTMAHYRITGLQNNVEDFANSLANPQTAFRHWLATQVAIGKIVSVDGYVFVQRSPEAPMKNCEVGDFLYKYFDSFESARKLGLHDGYRNVDLLAKYLLGEILKESLGVGPAFKFEEINVLIRDRHSAATTTVECNPLIASEPAIPQDQITLEEAIKETFDEFNALLPQELLDLGVTTAYQHLLNALVIPDTTKERQQEIINELISVGAITTVADIHIGILNGKQVVSIRKNRTMDDVMVDFEKFITKTKKAPKLSDEQRAAIYEGKITSVKNLDASTGLSPDHWVDAPDNLTDEEYADAAEASRDLIEDAAVMTLGLNASITQVDTKVNIVDATTVFFGDRIPPKFGVEAFPLGLKSDINHPEDYGVKPIATENVNDGNFVEIKDLKRLNTATKRSKPSVSGKRPN